MKSLNRCLSSSSQGYPTGAFSSLPETSCGYHLHFFSLPLLQFLWFTEPLAITVYTSPPCVFTLVNCITITNSGGSRGVPWVPRNPPFCRFACMRRRPRAHTRAQLKTFKTAEPHPFKILDPPLTKSAPSLCNNTNYAPLHIKALVWYNCRASNFTRIHP